jgi:TM2 domain-containing membrane protein YozV/Tfp pilus assembly major pilin PilA
MTTNNAYAPPTAAVDPTTKACQECGAVINKKAEICPKCGVRQKGMVNKTALLLITFFLGGLGGHKFYLRKPVQGVFYLLFFWAWIPGLIALVEFFIYAFTDEQRLNEKYEAAGGSVVIFVVVGAVALFFIMAILAAIAIPAYSDFTIRARTATALSEAKSLQLVVSMHVAETGALPASAATVPDAAPREVPNVAIVTLADNGVVVVRFSDSARVIAGTTIELIPQVSNNTVQWDCTGGTTPAKYRPAECRAQR